MKFSNGIVSVVLLMVMIGSAGAQVKNIAHRGGSKLAPENTVAAFKNAVSLKADYFELDVYLLKNDSLIVIHDNKVNRTTNGKGPIDSLSYTELRGLDAGSKLSPAFAGEKIPTLYEALKVAAEDKNNIGVVIELKQDDERLAERIIKMARSMGLDKRIIISGFYESLVEKIKAEAPGIKAQVFGTSNTNETIDQLKEKQIDWYGTGKAPTPEFIEYVHQKGMKLNVWTVNSEEKMRMYVKMGVDAITTDNPELLKRVLAEMKQ